MTNLIAIHNVETGEITEREMTAAELAQYQKDVLASKAEKAAIAKAAKDKAELLAKLGITDDEAKLLLS